MRNGRGWRFFSCKSDGEALICSHSSVVDSLVFDARFMCAGGERLNSWRIEMRGV